MNNFRFRNLLRFILALVLAVYWSGTAKGAGVTIVTHGFQLTSLDHDHNWVESMGDLIASKANGTPYVYRLVISPSSFTTLTATLTAQSSTLPPLEQSQNAEIIIKLYWDQTAGITPPADSTSIARIACQSLKTLNHSCELPIQIIGHSRGGSVASEMARFLGQDGIWVHQLTTLDPHPVSGTDANVQVWETVLFADNYYEESVFTFPDGEHIDGAFNEILSGRLPGGYGDDNGPLLSHNDHSDVHLWYNGTIDTTAQASADNITFTADMRANWYLPSEYAGAEAGFYYSRLGGGAWALDGFLFGYNNGGSNLSPDSRQPLPSRNANQWPSLVTVSQNSSGSVTAGNSFPVELLYQSYGAGASITLYLDPDENPYNANEIALTLPAINPQPSTGTCNGVGCVRTVDVDATVPVSTPPGLYNVFAKIVNSSGTRYLYSRNGVMISAAATPAAPTITSVSPTSLLTSSSAQTFQIFGSGFTANSTLLFNGSIASTAARLHFKNQNEIDYDLIVQSAGNWTVQVIDGAKTSNTKGFTVNNPSPTTGSLVVNLSPAGAVSAGAQWEVDGTGYNNSGQAAGYLTAGSHNVTFKPVSGYTAPATLPVTIVAGQQTTTQASYTTSTPNTYSLTLNYTSAQGQIAAWPPGSGGTYVANATVQLTASAASGYHFVSWGGDATGSSNPTTVTMNGNKTVTATFASGDPTQGTMTITIQPPEAVAAGVKWGLSANDYRDSGSSYTTFPASYVVYLHPVDGWIGPASLLATVTAGTTANYTATFTADTTPGLLSVDLSPPDAVTAGAKWRVNGGAPQGSGSTVSLAPGNYTITFDAATGWTAPPSQNIVVQRAQTATAIGSYAPPVGQPVITSVYPPIGLMRGGTVLTISGVNFTPSSTVLVGNIPATGVSVLGTTQISCVTPSNSVFGTAPIIVQTESGKATNLNGFAYGLPQGSGFDVINSFGGRCYGVGIQGNYAYVGEGKSLLVMNVSTPSNPSKVARVQLPGTVQDVAFFSHYAYVADAEGGVQILDISVPTAPVIKGFYQTPDSCGIAILGGRAYVADAAAGLEILDLTNPEIPALISSTNCGSSFAVAVKASATGLFAYVATGGQVCVVDVSDPMLPLRRGIISMNATYSLAVSGNNLFAASILNGVHMVDISNPDNLTDLGIAPGIHNAEAVTVANNLIYAVDNNETTGFYVYSVSGSTFSVVGHVTGVGATGFHIAATANQAYIAAGSAGFRVVNISSPASPTLSATFNDSGLVGFYGAAALYSHYVYAAGEGGFRAVDVASPGQPTLTSLNTTLTMTATGDHGRMLIANGYIIIADGYPRLVSLANPAVPTPPANPFTTALSVFDGDVSGNNLVLVGLDNGNNAGKLMIFDISSPSSPVQCGVLSLSPQGSYNPALQVAVSAGRALIGMNSGALKLIDVSNVNSPTELGQVLTATFPSGVAVSADGHYGFLLDGNANTSLTVFDISTPTSMLSVTNIPIDSTRGRRLTMRGSDLYLATYQGLYVFDVTDPTNPKLKRSYPSFGVAWTAVPGLGSPNNQTYVADGDGGVIALSERDLVPPNVYITNPTFSSVYTNNSSSMALGGGSDDNSAVTAITWSNSRGGGGKAGSPFDNWFVSGITLLPGTNVLTVTAFDATGNTGVDTVTVIYPITNQPQTITFPTIADQVFGGSSFPIVASASSGLPITFNIVSGPATISSNVVTLTGAGIVKIAANQPGNSTYNAAVSVTNSFNVAKADQSIIFGGLANKYINDLPFPINATASSGLSVSFSVLSGPANLSSNTLTITGSGTVTIRASQNGNANYNPALNVDRSFVVSKLPQFITFGALGRQVLGSAPFPLLATASSVLPVNFSVLSGPAIVNGNILTITGAGLVVLRASQSGDATYAPAPNVDQTLVITPGNNIITDSKYLQNGAFTFRFYGQDGTNYVVESSTDLVNWQRLITNQINGLGYLEFTDVASTNYSKRFYQALPLP